MKNTLDNYAGIIGLVFSRLAENLYAENSSVGDCHCPSDDLACSLERLLDADTVAEIIQTAKEIEHDPTEHQGEDGA